MKAKKSGAALMKSHLAKVKKYVANDRQEDTALLKEDKKINKTLQKEAKKGCR